MRAGAAVTRLLGACLVALPLIGSTAAAPSPQAVGIAAAVIKDVKIASAAAPQQRPVAQRQRIALADRVQTGKQSQLQVLLLDRSTFTVGANARLTIDRFIYDPAGGRSLGASVATGAFRFMSGRSNPRSSGTVTTPVATIGIRGTIVDGVVGKNAMAIGEKEPFVGKSTKSDPKTATLVVLRGPGAHVPGGITIGAIEVSAAGQTIALSRPMLAAYIPRAGAPPIGPFEISPNGLERLQDLISPALAQWRKQQKGPGFIPGLNIGVSIGGGRQTDTRGQDRPTDKRSPSPRQ